MKQTRSTVRLSLATASAAAALLLIGASAAPVYAQVSMTDPDAAVTCQAFQRWGYGDWTATAPTTLNYNNGMTLNVAPGQTFAPGQTIGGVEVTSTLDRHCGNL